MERKIKKTRCSDCKFYIGYMSNTVQKMGNVLLRAGERYCTGAKKPRMFKPRDPKVYLPSWCPQHKNPAELKIYCYKNLNTFLLRDYSRRNGLDIAPGGYAYALRYQGKSPVSALMLQERLKEEYLWQIIEETVHDDEVIEIDDGIVSYFFHVKDQTVKSIYFDREAALQNVLES